MNLQKINPACFFPYFSIMHLSYGTMAEWSIARACKALKSSVQIRLVPPKYPQLLSKYGGNFLSQFFMKTLSRIVAHPLATKSKVKFFGDFKFELEKTISELEQVLASHAKEDFILDWMEVGNHEISIRARETVDSPQKIISAIFRYHRDDEKYGNVHIEIVVSELSEKNIVEFLGKYLVTNRKKIIPDVVHMMQRGLRMHG